MLYGVRGHDFGKHPIKELTELYASLGVECVQLAIPKAVTGVESYADVGDGLLGEIKDSLKDAGVALPVLGCYIEPSWPDEAVRKRHVETFKRGVYCAAALEAGCIGTETTAFKGPERERPAALSRLSRSLEEMLTEAQKYNVTVAVEPVAAHTMNTAAVTASLLKRFEGSGLRAIFDPYNLLTPADVSTQGELWTETLDLIGSYITALHIKDAGVENGAFVPCELGGGALDYSVVAEWLRESAPGMPLLREGTAMERARRELDWMRKNFV